MPYNPGVVNRSGEIWGRAIENSKNNMMQAIGWVLQQSSQNKQLEKTLSTAFPENADEIKGMSLEQKQGFMAGKYLQQQQKAAEMTDALQMQQRQLNDQKIGAGESAAQGEAQLSPFYRAWQENAAGNGPDMVAFNSGMGPRRASGATPLQAALGAAERYPLGAESAGLSHMLPVLLRDQVSQANSQGQSVVPWKLGELGGGIETRTGKMFFDPDSEAKLARARRAGLPDKVSATSELAQFPSDAKFLPALDAKGQWINGLYTVTDGKGKVLGRWQNLHTASTRGLSLFDMGGGPAASAEPDMAVPAATPSGINFDDFQKWSGGGASGSGNGARPFTNEHFQQWKQQQRQ